jgi:hypothetical protein
MDRFQAQALIGLDGPDTHSPKAEVLEEIDRLEAIPTPHHPELIMRIRSLKTLLSKATETGGFRASLGQNPQPATTR